MGVVPKMGMGRRGGNGNADGNSRSLHSACPSLREGQAPVEMTGFVAAFVVAACVVAACVRGFRGRDLRRRGLRGGGLR